MVGLLIGLGLTSQFGSYASPDTGFLLDEAAKVLDGARLYVDLVEMNPPLTVLLNMAAVLAARWLGLSEILVYRLGCTAVFLAVMVLATWLLHRVLPREVVLRRAIILLLTLALFTLPGQDFGEREHLLLALVFPYLLLAVARARGCEIRTVSAAVIGLLPAIGFGIKPHFVLLWPAVELYLRLARRVPWRRVLPETAAIAGFLALYGLATLIWAPGYFRLVALLAGPYTQFLFVPFWELLLKGPGALLTVFALLVFFALGRRAGHPELPAVLVLGAVVCLVAGAAQQKGFSYHFYPALAFATMTLGVVAWDRRIAERSWVSSVYQVITIGVLSAVAVIFVARNVDAARQPVYDPEHKQMERLLPVVRARGAGERVYVMSYNISSAFPLINYAGARSASRFPQLWILGSVYMDQLRGEAPLRYRDVGEMSPSERFLNQAVFEDLRDQRPKLLVVLQHARDLPGNGFRRLDYIAYFSRDPRIAAVLNQYQRVADLGDFVVYERLAAGAVRSGPPPGVVPGDRDIIPAHQAGGVQVRTGNPGFLLAVVAFLVSAAMATHAEKVRASARLAPESARG